MLKRLLDGCFKRRGFSLIELSVVLVVSSLMLGFGLQAVQSTGAVDCTAITRQQMITIHAAVDKYVKAHGFYPRPAARGVAITDPQFGRQVAAGSYTTIDTYATGGSNILFGALPFQTLGLPASFAADCWGNKFTYDVSESLATDAASYVSGQGLITVNTSTLASPVQVTANAAYAVISHGPDGVGAAKKNFSNGGTNSNGPVTDRKWAGTGTAPNTGHIDAQNAYVGNKVVFVANFNNGKNAGIHYFDDFVTYAEKGQTADAACIGYSQCNGGAPVLSGGTCDTVPSTSPACPGSCASTTVHSTCNNGTYDIAPAANAFSACVSPACGCAASGGCGAVSNGGTCNTYSSGPTVTAPATCPAVTVSTCNNGTWGPSPYTATSCTQVHAGACNNAVALGCTTAAAAISDNGQTACGQTRQWICPSADGGPNSGTCSLANAACITGVCNNGAGTPACSPGNVISDNGLTGCGTTRQWICQSPNGGTNSGTCSYSNAACITGACNNAVALGCTTAAAAISDNGQTACGTTRQWVCPSPNGGANSPTCSKANSLCSSDGICSTTNNVCVNGSPSSFVGGSCGGNATWYCSGTGSGLTVSCCNTNPSCPVCGVSGACTVGTPSADDGASACGTTRHWSCTSYGSTTACTTANAACIAGGCNNAVALGCTNGGASFNDGGQAACGTTRTWQCHSPNGGADSGACGIANAACAGCASPCGAIAHGANCTAYLNASEPFGGSCTSQTRTCSNGSLSGSYTNGSCSVTAGASCASPCGTIAHGATCTAYLNASEPFGGSCTSQTRTCSNGTLSGSYTNASCSVTAGASCSLPWGGSIAHGASTTAYQASSVACGSSCTSETRSCNNGTLSGSYTNSSCSVAACCVPNGSCSGACGGGAGVDNCGNACTNNNVCCSTTISCSSNGYAYTTCPLPGNVTSYSLISIQSHCSHQCPYDSSDYPGYNNGSSGSNIWVDHGLRATFSVNYVCPVCTPDGSCSGACGGGAGVDNCGNACTNNAACGGHTQAEADAACPGSAFGGGTSFGYQNSYQSPSGNWYCYGYVYSYQGNCDDISEQWTDLFGTGVSCGNYLGTCNAISYDCQYGPP